MRDLEGMAGALFTPETTASTKGTGTLRLVSRNNLGQEAMWLSFVRHSFEILRGFKQGEQTRD
jgi:hypothetical protein